MQVNSLTESGELIRLRPLRVIGLMAVMLAPALLVLAAVFKASTYFGVPIATFTRDPTAVAQVPYYVGILSNLGILAWCAAGVLSLFAAVIVRESGGPRRHGAFLLCSALITFMLMFDDLFMLHECAFPLYMHINEKLVLACYMLLTGGYICAFRRVILHHDWPIFVASLGLFVVSVGVDVVEPAAIKSVHYLVEDGAKFLGVVLWAGFFARTAGQMLRHTMSLHSVPRRSAQI